MPWTWWWGITLTPGKILKIVQSVHLQKLNKISTALTMYRDNKLEMTLFYKTLLPLFSSWWNGLLPRYG